MEAMHSNSHKGNQLRKRSKVLLIPILMGLIVFEVVVGLERLNPFNIAWLSRTGWLDGWGAYLGWETYRYSPWSLPLGINQAYGMQIGNSLIYTDSIPLLGIPFKLVSPLLPVPFQYFGFWLLICFILQAIFSWKLFELFTSNKAILANSTLIMLFSPILFNRLNVHMSQCGHFLFLWSLYLIIKRPKSQIYSWLSLLSISALVHPYFLVMNSVLFISNIIYSYVLKLTNFSASLRIFLITVFSLTPILWLAGYFISLEGSTNPFFNELFKMDLLQPINLSGWSWMFAEKFPNRLGNIEGFNYLGPGTIFLAVLICTIAIFSRKQRRNLLKVDFTLWPVAAALALFTAYAITYKVTIARYEIFTLPLGETFKELLTSFRASGRFFAPVFYFSSFYVIKTIIRNYRNSLTLVALLVASLLQVGDTSYGWRTLKSINQPESSLSIGNIDLTAWQGVLNGRKNILWIPSIESSELCVDWAFIGYVAFTNHINTNCFYFARVSSKRQYENRQLVVKMLHNGDPSNENVLLLSEIQLAQHDTVRLAKNWQIAEVDGRTILTPLAPVINE